MGAENLKYSPYMIVKITGSEEKLEVNFMWKLYASKTITGDECITIKNF